MKHFGLSVVFGVPKSILHVQGAPSGRQRLRFRQNEAASLYVKTTDGIREFMIESRAEGWHCGPEVGRNLTSLIGYTFDIYRCSPNLQTPE